MARTATQVVTGTIRLSYLNVFKPRAIQDGAEPKYSACLLIPKTDKSTMNQLIAAVKAARQASAALFGGKIPDKLRLPWHDGDEEKPNGGDYGPEAKGMWVLNASSKQQPGIVDKRLNPILNPTELYSGCWARVDLNVYAYNTSGNKGIGVGLNNIQKIRDDEALGGKQRAEDVFDAMEDDDDLGL